MFRLPNDFNVLAEHFTILELSYVKLLPNVTMLVFGINSTLRKLQILLIHIGTFLFTIKGFSFIFK